MPLGQAPKVALYNRQNEKYKNNSFCHKFKRYLNCI